MNNQLERVTSVSIESTNNNNNDIAGNTNIVMLSVKENIEDEQENKEEQENNKEDNKEDNKKETYNSKDYQSVQLHLDIYSLFLMDWYARGSPSMKLIFYALITYILQLFALLSFSIAYIEEGQSGLDLDNSKIFREIIIDGETVIDAKPEISIWEYAHVHVLCFISGLLILFFYLVNSITHFSAVIAAFMNCDPKKYENKFNQKLPKIDEELLRKELDEELRKKLREKLLQRHFRACIFVSCLNIALAISTFLFSMNLMMFGVYWKISQPSDILFSSVGAVFILDLDDWIGQCRRQRAIEDDDDNNNNNSGDIFTISVKHKHFLIQLKFFQRMLACFMIVVAYCWVMSSLYMLVRGAGDGQYFYRVLFSVDVGLIGAFFFVGCLIVRCYPRTCPEKLKIMERCPCRCPCPWPWLEILCGVSCILVAQFNTIGYAYSHVYNRSIIYHYNFATAIIFISIAAVIAIFQMFCIIFDRPKSLKDIIKILKDIKSLKDIIKSLKEIKSLKNFGLIDVCWFLSVILSFSTTIVLRLVHYTYGPFSFTFLGVCVMFAWKYGWFQSMIKKRT